MVHTAKTTLVGLALLSLCVGLVAKFGTATAQQPEARIALVIGESAYQRDALATPANDAGLIANTLSEAGFDVIGARDLDQEALRKSFREFLDKAAAAGPGAVAFVYLAGYGVQMEGDNFIVPIGARIARDADVPIEALRLSDLTRSLSGVPLRARIVVFDGARSGPFAKAGPPLASGLALVEPDAGMLTAFNAAPGTVGPAESGPYGVYAQALAEMMRDGGLPLDDVFTRTRLRVNERTKGALVPWHSNKIDQPFSFFDRAPAAPPPAVSLDQTAAFRNKPIRDFSPEEAYAAAVDRDTIQGYQDFLIAYPDHPLARRVRAMLAARREAITWRRTVSANTPNAYWSYLKRYSQGPHAADARRRLARLTAPLEPPPVYDAFVYDVPPPPPEEYIIVDRPVLIFDEPDYIPPPPLPVYFLPPPPPEWAILPPPPPPPAPYYLPIPIPIPIPVWSRPHPPLFPPPPIVPPPGGILTPKPGQPLVAPGGPSAGGAGFIQPPNAIIGLQPGKPPQPSAVQPGLTSVPVPGGGVAPGFKPGQSPLPNGGTQPPGQLVIQPGGKPLPVPGANGLPVPGGNRLAPVSTGKPGGSIPPKGTVTPPPSGATLPVGGQQSAPKLDRAPKLNPAGVNALPLGQPLPGTNDLKPAISGLPKGALTPGPAGPATGAGQPAPKLDKTVKPLTGGGNAPQGNGPSPDRQRVLEQQQLMRQQQLQDRQNLQQQRLQQQMQLQQDRVHQQQLMIERSHQQQDIRPQQPSQPPPQSIRQPPVVQQQPQQPQQPPPQKRCGLPGLLPCTP